MTTEAEREKIAKKLEDLADEARRGILVAFYGFADVNVEDFRVIGGGHIDRSRLIAELEGAKLKILLPPSAGGHG